MSDAAENVKKASGPAEPVSAGRRLEKVRVSRPQHPEGVAPTPAPPSEGRLAILSCIPRAQGHSVPRPFALI